MRTVRSPHHVTTSVLQKFPLSVIEAATIRGHWMLTQRFGFSKLAIWPLGRKTNLCQESDWPTYSLLEYCSLNYLLFLRNVSLVWKIILTFR